MQDIYKKHYLSQGSVISFFWDDKSHTLNDISTEVRKSLQ